MSVKLESFTQSDNFEIKLYGDKFFIYEKINKSFYRGYGYDLLFYQSFNDIETLNDFIFKLQKTSNSSKTVTNI
jgi:hypothetical protein